MNDSARGLDKVNISKNYAKTVLLEGKETPIIHHFGKANFDSYPTKRIALLKGLNKFMTKVGLPLQEQFSGTELVRVEKYKELYVPGIGNDAIQKLNEKGYNFRQIAKKIGRNQLYEINIHHALKKIPWNKLWLNSMLNEGSEEIIELLTEINATDYYTNALARMGVGNGVAAVVATQTALQGGSTSFVAMETTFPSRTNQRVDFKGSYADGVAEFAWEEFSVDNGVTPNANLQRLLASKGTKGTGEVWTAEVQITFS